jgi:protein SCO1/2
MSHLSAGSMPAGADSGVSPRPGVAGVFPNRVEQIRRERLPNVKLITHEGRSVSFYDDLVKGRAVAIHFMYVRCAGICSPAIQNLIQARQLLDGRLRRRITFLSISLDAEKDTPDVLQEYAEDRGTGAGWYLLTGRTRDIERLRRKLGAYDPDPLIDADRRQHTGLVILGNEPKGRWSAIPALSNPVRIRQAIERTLLPPSQWTTGPAAVTEVPREISSTSDSRVKPFFD